MGCEKLNSARFSRGWRASFIFSTISARLDAEVHSLKGFITIITSASSTAIGSVGTSAVPILATTCLISGNRSINNFSAWLETSMLSESELPAGNVICMAKSPSSKVGINSAPSRPKSRKEPIKVAKATVTVCHLKRRQKCRHRWYMTLSFSKKRSANVGFTIMVCFKKREAIMGT